MKLSEFKQDISLDLGDLDAGAYGDGNTISAYDMKHMISSVNKALRIVNRKLAYNTDLVRLDTQANLYKYPITLPHAYTYTGTDASTDKYLSDNSQYPFTQDAERILGVYDIRDNSELIMNSSSSPFSLKTIGNTLIIPPDLGIPTLMIKYLKSFPIADVNATDDNYELPVPSELERAVVYYTCSRFHKLEGFDGTPNAANTFFRKFMSELKDVSDNNALGVSNSFSDSNLYAGGWER